MKLDELMTTAKDTFTVKRVFAEPVERDGVTLIPAATMAGAGGGGHGHDNSGQEGEGGGIGITARPAGVYVVKDGRVRWMPAVDVNRLFGTIGMVLVVYLLTRSRVVRARLKAKASAAG